MSSDQQQGRGKGRGRGKSGRGGRTFHKPKREKSNEQNENGNTKEGKEELNEVTPQNQEVPDKVTLDIQPQDLKKSQENKHQHVSSNPLARSRDGSEHDCCICTDPILYYGLGSCNHRDMCSTCAMRRRLLYQEFNCPVCRIQTDPIIITGDTKLPFEQFNTKTFEYYEPAKALYTNADGHFAKLCRLWEIRCPMCDKSGFDMNSLKSHVRQEHNLQFCQTCLDSRKVFLQEQKLYTSKELSQHLKAGDKDTLIKHEYCEFCQVPYFDKDDLFRHLQGRHQTCFLCERNGVQYQYYKDARELEKHMRKEHFLCEHHDCKGALMAFKSEMDLRLHEVESHSDKLSKNEKKSARQLYALRGSSVSSMVNENEEEVTPPPREPVPTVNSEEAFPSLTEQPARSTPMTRQWSRPRENFVEDFPSLSPASTPNAPSGAWRRNGSASNIQNPPQPPQPVSAPTKGTVLLLGSLPRRKK